MPSQRHLKDNRHNERDDRVIGDRDSKELRETDRLQTARMCRTHPKHKGGHLRHMTDRPLRTSGEECSPNRREKPDTTQALQTRTTRADHRKLKDKTGEDRDDTNTSYQQKT